MRKLKWKRTPSEDDEFALALVDPTQADVDGLRRRLEDVCDSTGVGDRRLRAEARDALHTWVEDISQLLPSRAFARLSNWFLTGKSGEPESNLGLAARIMWRHLFCAEPEERLTEVNPDNSVIIPERFAAWWRKQQRCQDA